MMKRTMYALGLLISASGGVWAQGSSEFAALLSGKTTIALKDLGPNYKRLTVTGVPASGGGMDLSQLAMLGAMGDKGKGKGGPGEAMGAMMGMSMLSSLFGGGMGAGSGETVLYTEGGFLTLGGESFLVAYRYKKPATNILQLAMESAGEDGKEPDLAKLAGGKMTGDSLLTLTLVNLRTVGTMSDIRPFDLARELAEGQQSGGLMDLIAASMKEDAAKASAAKPAPAPKPKPAPGVKPRS